MRKITVLYDGTLYTYIWLKAILTLKSYFRERGYKLELLNILSYLPVAESFGFTQDLRSATAGQAFPQCVFSHWQAFTGGDPLTEGTKTNEMVKSIRNRKGLAPEVPTPDRFLDKL